MSESLSGGFDFDDVFGALTNQLAEDPGFVKRVDDIDDQMEENDVRSLFEHSVGMNDPKGTYYLEPVGRDLQKVVDGFHAYCRDRGVDLYDDYLSGDTLDQLSEYVAREVYNIHKQLVVGDTISATEVMIIDSTDAEVIRVDDGLRIQGEFESPVLNPMPDDFSAAIFNEGEPIHAPLGVGLIIQDPVIIGHDGSREPLESGAGRVIIALGTSGLKIDKHFYQSENPMFRPPKDTPYH